jgi:hypothetical protein
VRDNEDLNPRPTPNLIPVRGGADIDEDALFEAARERRNGYRRRDDDD